MEHATLPWSYPNTTVTVPYLYHDDDFADENVSFHELPSKYSLQGDVEKLQVDCKDWTERKREQWIAFTQRWVFFGLLSAFLGNLYCREDYVAPHSSHMHSARLTTSTLN